MKNEKLIFTASGIRGVVGKTLTLDKAKQIANAFGLWLKEKKVIIGRDTRPSGESLKNAMIDGLRDAGCKIQDVNVCPTPAIIYTKNLHNIKGGIIISGSHNPPEWNGIKLLSDMTFLSGSDLAEITESLESIENEKDTTTQKSVNKPRNVQEINTIEEYKKGLLDFFNVEKIKNKNYLRIGLDTGAGAGKYLTPDILEKLGCQVILINNDFTENGKFPREIEPIEKNLQDLIELVKEENLDVGFAHDCDADRIAIIGNDGTCYPQDIGLALITEYYLKQFQKESQSVKFITNLASSLCFEALAQKYNAEIIRTPVGERHLAEKMHKLLEKDATHCIFGGEGSCGGVMVPTFNNARDGIFAAAQIVEILVNTGEKISTLVQKLPKYYSFRKNLDYGNIQIKELIKKIQRKLEKQYDNIRRVDNDLRFGEGDQWFVLIHPSNTEPIVRIITEAKNKEKAKKTCNKIANIVLNMIENA